MDFDRLSTLSFFALAAILLLLERLPGLRRARSPIAHRWVTNLGLMLIGGLVVSLLFPASATEIAKALEGGVVRQLQLSPVVEVVVVFLLLDCWRYWEHRLFHEVPLLWRVHLVHHSDTALDVTTAERHHPFERIITTIVAFILVFSLGFSVYALGIYFLVAMLSSLYTHANIALPDSIDKPLRWLLVTPAVHATHHSDFQPETDSNYGSVLTLWDRLFGTYTDPSVARIPRFGLHYFRQPQDTALGPVLLQPFEYNRAAPIPMSHDERMDTAARERLPVSPAWRQALRYGALGIGLALLAMGPTAAELATLWSRSEPYQYAWLVLPMFVYVVGWYHRDVVLSLTPKPSYAGLGVVLFAAALWVTAFVVDIQLGKHLALVLVLQGIALSTLGWKTYRSLLPMMLFLFLMVPCGDVLQPALRALTVKWIEWFAVLMNLPHTVAGYVVHIGEHRYVVIDTCSGLTYFTLAGFLGYSFGLLLFRSLTKIFALAALAAALGIFTNALRVTLIVGIDWLRGTQMDMGAHQDLQWLALLLSLALLLYLANRFKHDDSRSASEAADDPASVTPVSRYAPALAGTLILVTVGAAHGFDTGRNATALASLQQIASRYPESRWLAGDVNSASTLEIPLAENIAAILIAPEPATGRVNERGVSLEDATWRHADTRRYRDCQRDACITFVHTTWKRKESTDARHVFYAYYVGDTVTDSKLAFRVLSGWNRISGASGATGLIGFNTLGVIPPKSALASAFERVKTSWSTTKDGDITVGAGEANQVTFAPAARPIADTHQARR